MTVSKQIEPLINVAKINGPPVIIDPPDGFTSQNVAVAALQLAKRRNWKITTKQINGHCYIWRKQNDN